MRQGGFSQTDPPITHEGQLRKMNSNGPLGQRPAAYSGRTR